MNTLFAILVMTITLASFLTGAFLRRDLKMLLWQWWSSLPWTQLYFRLYATRRNPDVQQTQRMREIVQKEGHALGCGAPMMDKGDSIPIHECLPEVGTPVVSVPDNTVVVRLEAGFADAATLQPVIVASWRPILPQAVLVGSKVQFEPDPVFTNTSCVQPHAV